MSLNKVILIGNVGKDPDVRYFDNGNAVAKFTLATSERGYKLANGTEVPERTEWHNIVATRDHAQFAEKHIKKGSLLYVEGKIRSRSYDDKDGNKRYMTEIYADRLDFYWIGGGNRKEQEAGSTDHMPADNSPAATDTLPVPEQPADDLPF
ncbi:MAG: single-stranded DNA-binding protein [Tannerella sp.]|jgi:single-strand DNA-binding protein|nr:single-stranded DNA-binding protein [Tannerella sp.]